MYYSCNARYDIHRLINIHGNTSTTELNYDRS